MKKILILWFLAIGMANAQNIRIGVINGDTTTRPLTNLSALAWRNNNLYIVKPTGNTVKFLQNDSRLWVGDNNRVGVGTKTPSQPFEVAGNAKISGSLQIGVGSGLIRSDVNGLLMASNITLNDLPFLGSIYVAHANGVVSDALDFTESVNIGNVFLDRMNEPGVKLQIGISDAPTSLNIVSGAGNSSLILSGTTGGEIINLTNSLKFRSNLGHIFYDDSGTELMRINNNGNFGINNPSPTVKFDVNGSGKISGNLELNDITDVRAAINSKQNQINGTGFVKASGTTLSYDNSTYLTTSSAVSTYGSLSANNNFIGSNLFLTPVFANSTSTSSFSSITGAWSNTGNLGIFSLRYNTKVGASTVTWNPIRLDANGWVGIGMDPSQAFEVLGAAKFNSAVTATSIAASGAVSALSYSSTTGASFGTSSGNVGIGTSAPTSKLHVDGTTPLNWVSGGNSNGLVTIGTGGISGSSLWINTPSVNSVFNSGFAVDGTYSNPGGIGTSIINIGAYGVKSGGGYNSAIAFKTTTGVSATEKMRIDANGNVGINTTTPTSKLQVVGLPVYADNSAATTGGLTAGAFYRTSTGVLMVVY